MAFIFSDAHRRDFATARVMRYQHPEAGQVGDVINKRSAKRKSVTAQSGHTFGHSTLHCKDSRL